MREKHKLSSIELKETMKDWVLNSWQLPMLIIVLGALVFYVFTMADLMRQLPSEGVSREILVNETGYGYSRHNTRHTVSEAYVPEDKIGIFSVDGHSVSMDVMHISGDALLHYDLAIDLYNARALSAYFEDASTFVVVAQLDALIRIRIDLKDGTYELRELAPALISFQSSGTSIVIEKEDGLYGLVIRENGTEAVMILSGKLKAFDLDDDGEHVYVAATSQVDSDHVDATILNMDRNFENIQRYSVRENDNTRELKVIEDVYFHEGVISILYVYQERKYSHNYLTVKLYDMSTGAYLDQFRTRYSISSSPVTIVQRSEDAVTVVRDESVNGSLNIIKEVISHEGSVMIPMTKTGKPSSSPAYLEMGDEEALVFSDLDSKSRRINFASSHEAMIKRTYNIFTLDLWTLAGSSLIVFMGSMFASLIFLPQIVAVPSLVLVGMLIVTRERKLSFYVYMGAAVVLHTFFKYLVTQMQIIEKPNLYLYQASYLGHTVSIYVTLFASTIIAIMVAMRMTRVRGQASALYTYTVFAVADMMIYAMTVVSFAFTEMLMGKL